MSTLAGAGVLALGHLQAYRFKFVDVFLPSKRLSSAGGTILNVLKV